MRGVLCGLCVLFLQLLPPAWAGDIYRYTDANGRTVFTSQPPQGTGAQKVELGVTNQVSDQGSAAAAPVEQMDREEYGGPPYERIELTGLPADGVLRSNDGSFSVGGMTTPALMSGHQLRFLMDGSPVQPASGARQVSLSNVDRGAHQLQLEVVDRQGQTLQRGDVESLVIQRISTNSPARR